MAVCLMAEFPGATLQQYEQIREALGEPSLGEGQLSHVAGATGNGICVVDIWQSRAHFDRFVQERLGVQMGTVGLPQPEITEFEVHSYEHQH
jgi:hypothetical protein